MNDFRVGDRVKVFGNDKDIFKIVGYRTKQYHAFGRTSDETMFLLEEVNTRNSLEIHKSFVVKLQLSADELLDQYIDYITLFELFKDESYKKHAEQILETLGKNAKPKNKPVSLEKKK